MADYNINAVTRRVVYDGSSGIGPYAFSFEVLEQTDIVVYFNTTKLTLTTDYTVTINANGTGSVTIVTGTNVPSTPTASDQIVVVGARDLERVTDFVTAGDLRASALNDQLDSLVIFDQQISEEGKRTLRAPVYDPALVEDGGTLDMTLPAKATRAGKLLGFDDTTGNPVATFTVDDASTISAISADIGTLADIEDGTVATDAISGVAAISSDVTTVSGIAGNVSTVAGISSNVTSVAGNATNINTVAGISGNVTTVAGISADVTTVAGETADIGTLADIEDGTVATNAISNLGPISTDITTVSGISSNVTSVAGNATNINTVAGVSSNVTTVAGISGNVTTVAGISSDVTTVAGISSNVTTVANNVTGVNSFAERYRVAASDPVTSLDEGDLVYNTTSNALKFYDGSSWNSVNVTGIGTVADDTTPQLGGNLDLNSFDITGTGNLNFTGNVTLTGTVDGRDVATDGTKLDGIESGATADQTGAEIASALSGEALSGVASAGITGDLTVDTDTLYVDSTNNRVGVGTTSPASLLDVSGTLRLTNGTTPANFGTLSDGGGLVVTSGNSNPMYFYTGGSERMRIDSSGNVGIGTTPSSKIHSYVASGANLLNVETDGTTGSDTAEVKTDAGGYYVRHLSYGSGSCYLQSNASSFFVGTNNTGLLRLQANSIERMRFDGVGNIYSYGNHHLTGTASGVATTNAIATNYASNYMVFNTTGSGASAYFNQAYADSASRYQIQFWRNSSYFVGSIQSSSTGTGYYTTSDYRLKENVVTITDGIERLKQLKPSRFNFISTPEKTVDGFLAHEAGAVVPEAITGEKDGMRDEEYEVTSAVLDDDGNVVTEAVMGTRTVPEYQQIDEAKIVPLLTAALQEAVAKIEALEARVSQLEGA